MQNPIQKISGIILTLFLLGSMIFIRARISATSFDFQSSNFTFFWLAGQGGFGIQTAPAAAMLAASMLSEAVAPPPNVDGNVYLPDRLH